MATQALKNDLESSQIKSIQPFIDKARKARKHLELAADRRSKGWPVIGSAFDMKVRDGEFYDFDLIIKLVQIRNMRGLEDEPVCKQPE